MQYCKRRRLIAVPLRFITLTVYNATTRVCISPYRLTNALHKSFLMQAFSRRPAISNKNTSATLFGHSLYLFKIIICILSHKFTKCNIYLNNLTDNLAVDYIYNFNFDNLAVVQFITAGKIDLHINFRSIHRCSAIIRVRI